MKTFRLVLLLALAFSSVRAFTTKKKERRTSLQHVPFTKEATREQRTQSDQTAGTDTSGNAMFAFAPSTMPVQVVQHFETEEEADVSYSVALVSCMLSLALGFGLGYGT